MTTPELIRSHGYGCEEHVVGTSDGYFLILHRIIAKSPKNDHQKLDTKSEAFPSPPHSTTSSLAAAATAFTQRQVARSGSQSRGQPVIMVHGAMMSSEVWVCNRKSKHSLAFHLVDEGFDVWLTNRRGNRYGQKHSKLSPSHEDFWNFSLDDSISHDVPAQIEYVHQNCDMIWRSKLVLIAFSQGSAECFGTLSMNTKIQSIVSCIIALSASAKPMNIPNDMVRSMIHWTPQLIFLLFGRKSMLSSVLFWRSLLSPQAMVWLLDFSMRILFKWKLKNMRSKDKLQLYQYLYAETSVKQIVHWFQIMSTQRFQMYDQKTYPLDNNSIMPMYPLGNIKVPITIISGTNDNLMDFEHLQATLQNSKICKIAGFEHMDIIWGYDAPKKVFPPVLEAIRESSLFLAPGKKEE